MFHVVVILDYTSLIKQHTGVPIIIARNVGSVMRINCCTVTPEKLKLIFQITNSS